MYKISIFQSQSAGLRRSPVESSGVRWSPAESGPIPPDSAGIRGVQQEWGGTNKYCIKAHFSWTWQCTTLNRGDELINLLLNCLQPHSLLVPNYTTPDGRHCGVGKYYFGVLSLYHETKVSKPGVRSYLYCLFYILLRRGQQKQEPDYNFVLPHRNPLRCSVGALAIILHYIFDQENVCEKVENWKWSCPLTWRKASPSSSEIYVAFY
jgi:hypothetical protein